MKQQKMSGEAEFTASSFDAERPAAFYLLDNPSGLEALSDATLVVDDVELPVHSQVLSLQSKVLLDMFTAVESSPGDAKATLKEPFVGYSLFEVALFLRFMYQPTNLTQHNLWAVRGSLLGLLRLAHKLDAPRIIKVLAQHMCECTSAAATQVELIAWAQTAEQCHLRELQLRCLMEAARRLACDGGNLASGFTAAAGLAACCDHSTLATLLGLLANASGPDATSRLLAVTPAAAGAALEASTDCGSFEWAFEGYSQLPAAVGHRAVSPDFEAAGTTWHFEVCPGGLDAQSAGHLTVYIGNTQGGIDANLSVTIVDQGPLKQDMRRQSEEPKRYHSAGTRWGWTKFIAADELHNQSKAYLRGDRLLLRATVEVTHRNVQPAAT